MDNGVCERGRARPLGVSRCQGMIPSVVDTRAGSPQVSHTVVPLSTHRANVRHSQAAIRRELPPSSHRHRPPTAPDTARELTLVQSLDDARRRPPDGRDRGVAWRTRRARGPDPAAQPRGRGVAPRSDDAQPRGDHRRGRGAPRDRRLLQARARRRSSRPRYGAAQPGASRSTRSRSPRSCAARASSTRSAAARRCCGSRPRRPRRRTRRTTRRSSPSSRCCGA